MAAFYYLRHFLKPLSLMFILLLFGVSGYRFLEGWSLLDCLYMTCITLSTVGFSEAAPLSNPGKIFTMALIFTGVIFYAYTINSIFNVFVEKKFTFFMIETRMKNKIKRLKNHIIICGGGVMSLTLCEELEKAGTGFVVIEKSKEAPIMEYQNRWPILEKDALLEETLLEARVDHARGLAAVLTGDSDNLFVVLTARKLNPKLTIQTRIISESTRNLMKSAGADTVVSPKRVGGLQIARTFINPEVQDFLSIVMDRASSLDIEIKMHQITEGDPNFNKTIQETDFRNRGFIVIAVRDTKGEVNFAPPARTVLKEGFAVFIIGPGNLAEKQTEAARRGLFRRRS